MSEFDPGKYMIKIPRRKKLPNGQWVDEPGPEYLPVAARIAWFRAEHPRGSINTTAEVDSVHAVTRCEIRDEEGRLLAGDVGLCTAEQWKRYAEKASTTAIGRALAAAGYGTLQAGEDFAEDDHLADSPRETEPEKRPPTRIEQPKPMQQRVAVQAAVKATTDDLNDRNAMAAFWAKANEMKIGREAVHQAFGLGADRGALLEYLQSEQKGWRWALQELQRHLANRPPQPALDGMPEPARQHGDPVDARR